jgi:GNAT superfamily N-acetyltransferase
MLDAESTRRHFADGLRYHVYEDNGDLVGVVATREDRHLFNLFVAEHAQGRGIARLLWKTAREACVGPEVVKDEVIVIPMRLAR